MHVCIFSLTKFKPQVPCKTENVVVDKFMPLVVINLADAKL